MHPRIIFALKDWSEPGEWGFGGPKAEEQFADEVEAYDGEEIVKLDRETDGYFNIEFADGHQLQAVSAFHIEMRDWSGLSCN